MRVIYYGGHLSSTPSTHTHTHCHPQTDCFVISQLISVAKHVGRLKLESKPAQIYVRLSIIPINQQANYVSSGIIRHYVVAFVCLHFCLTGYQSAQFIRRALYYTSGSRKFPRQGAQPSCESIWWKVHMITHVYSFWFFFYQYGPQGELYWKVDLICSHFIYLR